MAHVKVPSVQSANACRMHSLWASVHKHLEHNARKEPDVDSARTRQQAETFYIFKRLTFSWHVMPESIPRVEMSSSPSTRLF